MFHKASPVSLVLLEILGRAVYLEDEEQDHRLSRKSMQNDFSEKLSSFLIKEMKTLFHGREHEAVFHRTVSCSCHCAILQSSYSNASFGYPLYNFAPTKLKLHCTELPGHYQEKQNLMTTPRK